MDPYEEEEDLELSYAEIVARSHRRFVEGLEEEDPFQATQIEETPYFYGNYYEEPAVNNFSPEYSYVPEYYDGYQQEHPAYEPEFEDFEDFEDLADWDLVEGANMLIHQLNEDILAGEIKGQILLNPFTDVVTKEDLAVTMDYLAFLLKAMKRQKEEQQLEEVVAAKEGEVDAGTEEIEEEAAEPEEQSQKNPAIEDPLNLAEPEKEKEKVPNSSSNFEEMLICNLGGEEAEHHGLVPLLEEPVDFILPTQERKEKEGLKFVEVTFFVHWKWVPKRLPLKILHPPVQYECAEVYTARMKAYHALVNLFEAVRSS